MTWQHGTMLQTIGRELISLGIDNANYGINSTPGQGEWSHPYLVAQVTAHNSRGKYANGIQTPVRMSVGARTSFRE